MTFLNNNHEPRRGFALSARGFQLRALLKRILILLLPVAILLLGYVGRHLIATSLAQSPSLVTERWGANAVGPGGNRLRLRPAGPVNLTVDSPANDQNPAWSPNGERIVFTSGRSGNNELWLMDDDGSDLAALTSNGAENVNLPGRAWCPGNGRIVFASDVGSENDEIYSIASDGTDLQRLTATEALNWEPSWAPDCSQIVFQSDRSGNPSAGSGHSWDIWRMNANGSNPVRLTDDPADDWEPNWSPDGTTIAFQSNRSGNPSTSSGHSWDIWTMDVNGGTLTNVTDHPTEDTDPSWSPDGAWIVYSSDRGGDDGSIWAIPASGGTPVQITDDPAYDGAPSWSPDGQRIAFESERSGNLDIWVVDAPAPTRREFPDTTDGIHVFNDQLAGWDMTEAQFQFAATHYAGTQKMIRSDTRHLRSYNPDFIVLHYRLGLGLGYRTTDGSCNPTGGYLQVIEGDSWVQEWPGEAVVQDSWFFPYAGADRVLQCTWGWYLMELDDPSWRANWMGEVLRQLAANENDGLFADSFSVPNYLGGSTFEPDLPAYDPAFESEWATRIENFIDYVQAQFTGQYYLIPNIGYWVTTRNPTDYSNVDGVMIEGFSEWDVGSPFVLSDWQLQMNRILGLTNQGKVLILQPYVDETDIEDRMFVLANYLLVKGVYSFINMDLGLEPEWFPEYEIPIGSPVDPLPADIDDYLDPSGLYQRGYTGGLVLVNPGTTTRTIDLGSTYYLATPSGGGWVPDDGDTSAWMVNYTPVTSVTLAPNRGAILLLMTPPCDLPGDLDGDGDVDVVDIMLVASRWNSSVGDLDYDPTYDLDDDEDIDIVDIMLVAVHWGDTCQTGIAAIWAVGDGEKVKQDELDSPLKDGNSVWDGTEINIFGARNEVGAFQLVIEAGSSGASDVYVSVTDLVSGTHRIANDFTLPGADQADLNNSVGRRIELFREHYLHVTEPSRTLYIADMNNLNGPGWWPDPLIPFDVGKARGGAPFDIAPNRNQAVWVDIYIPKGTPAGRYLGTVTVTENDGVNPQAIPLTLTVYDFTLPDENHPSTSSGHRLRTWAYIGDPWRITERHGLDNPGSEAYYQVENQYVKMAHRHRLDAVTDRDLEWVTDNEASYLDGSLFNAANGYEGPGEGFGVQIFPPVIEAWGSQADFNASVNGWYDWFTAHGLDWSKAIYYIWDEPGPDDYDWIKGRADWDHALAHPIKVFLTEYINPALIRGSAPEWIDFWCPPASEGAWGYDVAAAAARRAAGYEVGVYNGHRPGAGTILIDDDAIAPRTWGWIAFKHDVDLWYLWDVTYWLDYQGDGLQTDLWDDPLTFDCENRDWENVGNGDGTLFYPGQDVIYPAGDRGIAGPISSIRMKNWRRGMQDYEYLWLARSLGHGAEVEAIVAERIPAVLSDATGLPVKSWSSRGAGWEASRRAIADLIVGG